MRKSTLIIILGLTSLCACNTPTENTTTQATTTQATSSAVAENGNDSNNTEGDTTTQPVILRVGATPVPAGELLAFIKPELARQGIQLEITEFTDYVTPNTALGEGSLDANMYQHVPYLETFQKNNPLNIVPVRGVYLPPLSLYSKTVQNVADLPDGATIAVPNDPSNEVRALLLLEKGGLITLTDDADSISGLESIVSNPKNFKFLELEAAQLPRSLDDTDASIVNTNYALEVGLSPLKDSILHEDKDSPYVNVLATTADRLNDPNIQKLADALTSDAVREWLLEKYQGSIMPAF